jgi:hypothetical protein
MHTLAGSTEHTQAPCIACVNLHTRAQSNCKASACLALCFDFREGMEHAHFNPVTTPWAVFRAPMPKGMRNAHKKLCSEQLLDQDCPGNPHVSSHTKLLCSGATCLHVGQPCNSTNSPATGALVACTKPQHKKQRVQHIARPQNSLSPHSQEMLRDCIAAQAL